MQTILSLLKNHTHLDSRALAARGWVGVTLPGAYGGAELGAFDRFMLVEELLAAGAPVGAHWIADRQSGPLILRYGTEDQKAHYLPRICRGEAFFGIGMSEPNAGSDLAGVGTRATRCDLGRFVARLGTLRHMSNSITAKLAAGQSPVIEAALVKDIGTEFEQRIPVVLEDLIGAEPGTPVDADLLRALAHVGQIALLGALQDARFLELLTGEERGGGGATLADLYPVVALGGRCAMPFRWHRRWPSAS